MLELVGLEFGNVGGKLGVVATQRRELARIMAVDLGLDGVGAGELSAMSAESSGSSPPSAASWLA